MKRMREICSLVRIIPVLVVDEAAHSKDLGQALVNGGFPVLEVTLRTKAALQAIESMASIDGAIVGAGTLLSAADVRAAKQAGAQFGVSPGATDAVLTAAQEIDLPLLPGAATASEVMRLLDQGYDVQKFFPAQAAGGVAMLQALGGPIPQVAFCPTGGVSPQNVQQYLALSNVICVGGSWIADKARIKAAAWNEIEAVARQASGI